MGWLIHLYLLLPGRTRHHTERPGGRFGAHRIHLFTYPEDVAGLRRCVWRQESRARKTVPPLALLPACGRETVRMIE